MTHRIRKGPPHRIAKSRQGHQRVSQSVSHVHRRHLAARHERIVTADLSDHRDRPVHLTGNISVGDASRTGVRLGSAVTSS